MKKIEIAFAHADTGEIFAIKLAEDIFYNRELKFFSAGEEIPVRLINWHYELNSYPDANAKLVLNSEQPR